MEDLQGAPSNTPKPDKQGEQREVASLTFGYFTPRYTHHKYTGESLGRRLLSADEECSTEEQNRLIERKWARREKKGEEHALRLLKEEESAAMTEGFARVCGELEHLRGEVNRLKQRVNSLRGWAPEGLRGEEEAVAQPGLDL